MTTMAFVASHWKPQRRFLDVPGWNRKIQSCPLNIKSLGLSTMGLPGPQLLQGILGDGATKVSPVAGHRMPVGSSYFYSSSSSAPHPLWDNRSSSQRRLFSSSDSSYNNNNSIKMQPSYQVYGEVSAFTMKVMLPNFRILGSSTVVLDAKSRGRLLLEWTPRKNDGRFAWDTPLRFALSVEEAGSILSNVTTAYATGNLLPLEFIRSPASPSSQQGSSQFADIEVSATAAEKVFRVTPLADGSVKFAIDFELNGRGGFDPPTTKEAKGPLEITLMAGEYQVVKSIIEYSLPRLIGWSTMMDHAIEKSIMDQINNGGGGGGSSGGGYGNGVPF